MCAIFVASVPAFAQVEKVAMRTTGISCGICAGLSEIYFRRVPGIANVKISLSKEAILLTYQQGAAFDPAAIRKVLKPLEVGVTQFQISARGRIQKQGDNRIFIAGQQTFAVFEAIDSPDVPLNTLVEIEGIVFDGKTPMEVKILNFKPVK